MIECLLCAVRFSEADIDQGKLLLPTFICRRCYQTMKKGTETCFGKREFYSAMAQECRYLCPDRKVCPQFLDKEPSEEPVQGPFRNPESVIYQAFDLCRQGTTLIGLRHFVRGKGMNLERVLRIFRWEQWHGWKWVFKETLDNRLQVVDVEKL